MTYLPVEFLSRPTPTACSSSHTQHCISYLPRPSPTCEPDEHHLDGEVEGGRPLLLLQPRRLTCCHCRRVRAPPLALPRRLELLSQVEPEEQKGWTDATHLSWTCEHMPVTGGRVTIGMQTWVNLGYLPHCPCIYKLFSLPQTFIDDCMQVSMLWACMVAEILSSLHAMR